MRPGAVRRKAMPGWDFGPYGRLIVGWAMPNSDIGIPAYTDGSVPAVARKPHPPEAVEPVPRTAVIGPPTPGVTGDPGVSDGGIVTPVADSKGIPAGADAGGRPGHAIARDVVPVAVIVEIVPSRIIRITGVGSGAGSVFLQSCQGLVPVGVPLVPCVGCNALNHVI